MEGKRELWVKAAILLSKNPKAKVLCPECQIGYLIVRDEPIEGWDKIDRYMICDNCGEFNILTKNDPMHPFKPPNNLS